MRKAIENIRESEVEDALVQYIDILKEILNVDKEVRLITRQLRLIEGKKRLDILLAVGDEIFLIELKTEPFRRDHIEQILTYKDELKKLQREKELIPGEVVPVLLVTDFKEVDFNRCEENGIKIYAYSPVDTLTKYYDKVASIAKFMKVRPVDLGVFNIGLINRVMGGLENGLSTLKDLSAFSQLSDRSITHHLKFATELGLVTQR